MKNIQSLLAGLVAALSAVSAHATTAPPPPTTVDEPSMFALAAVGAIAGLLVWRSRRKR